MRVGDCVRALPSIKTWSLPLSFLCSSLPHLYIAVKSKNNQFILPSNFSCSSDQSFFFNFGLIFYLWTHFSKQTKQQQFFILLLIEKQLPFWKGMCTDSLTGQPGNMYPYRFSAFWLRSKCSICSYQLNIWYGLHSRSRILNWFLTDWAYGWACSPGPAGRHGIALPPWAASSLSFNQQA